MQTIEKQFSLVVTSPTQKKHTCICCRANFVTVELQRAHFKTEWHLYNLKRRICLLDPIDLEGFNAIQDNNTQETADDAASNFDTSSYVDLGGPSSPETIQTLDDEDWEKIGDDEEFLDEDYDDDEIDDLLCKMIQRDTCLFCDRKSDDMQLNVDHMNQIHGFFIPEEQHLIDLGGLIDYLGFKVGAGATCLWCNKQFTSLHGVRLHMQYKDHCKIFYDQERAIEEFRYYYDYTNQEQIPMKPIDKLEVMKRRTRRHSYHNRSLVTSSSPSSTKNKLVSAAESAILVKESDAIKKFSSQRAQNLLRVGLIGNKTARGRLRHQNPI